MAKNPSTPGGNYGIDVNAILAGLTGGGSTGSTSNAVTPVSLLGDAAAAAGGGTPFDQWVATFGFKAQAQQFKGVHISDFRSPPVFMGGNTTFHPVHIGATYDPETHGKTSTATPKHTSHTDDLTTTDAAKNIPATWSTQEVSQVIKSMQGMGFNVSNYSDMMGVWSDAVDRASQTYVATNGKTKITPWDALALYGNEMKASGATAAGPFTGERTQVARSVSDISEGQAWSVLQSQLSQMLGRDPSDQEVRDFTYRMNSLAARNPSISKTVAQYKNGQEVSSSTHSNPGFTAQDAQQAAYNDAQRDPEYGAYQAASTYFNSALSALGAIGNVG